MKFDELFFYFSLFFLSFMVSVKIQSGDYDRQIKRMNELKCSIYKKVSNEDVAKTYFKDCF
jgi:hypothetical protein